MNSRLRLMRAEQGWTQEDLASAIGESRQAINALETERHDPSLDLAYKIAAAFNVPVENVFPNPHEQGEPS